MCPRLQSQKVAVTMHSAKRIAGTGNGNNDIRSCNDTRSTRRLAEMYSGFLDGVKATPVGKVTGPN